MTAEELERRLRRLERGRRRLLLALGAVVAVALLTGQGAPPDRVVEGTAFVLRDREGNARALLRVQDEGSAVLSFHDADGRLRAVLGLGPDGAPALVLQGGDGHARAGLHVPSGGGPGLYLRDAGAVRADLSVTPEGTSRLALKDERGVTTFEAP